MSNTAFSILLHPRRNVGGYTIALDGASCIVQSWVKRSNESPLNGDIEEARALRDAPRLAAFRIASRWRCVSRKLDIAHTSMRRFTMLVEFEKFEGQLPYASSLFGIYQPLIGWYAARMKRFFDPRLPVRNGLIRYLSGKFLPDIRNWDRRQPRYRRPAPRSRQFHASASRQRSGHRR